MDETLQALAQIAQSGGPVLLLAVMWVGVRALRAAEKAVDAFNAMRVDIAEVKQTLLGAVAPNAQARELVQDIDKRMQSIDLGMAENGRKLDQLIKAA